MFGADKLKNEFTKGSINLKNKADLSWEDLSIKLLLLPLYL